jgi:putative transcriptional regulator
MKRLLLVLLLASASAAAQPEAPNGLLLVAKPSVLDPNFRQTVILVTQASDASTVGVILNRPTESRHDKTGELIHFGGPVMREVLVALFRSEGAPPAAAFHILKGVYLSMHPQNIEALLAKREPRHRLYAGFAGWAPGQLQSELSRDDWYTLAPTAELLFRTDTRGMWEELVSKARARVTMR